MDQILLNLAKAIPSLKTPIQLSAFAFGVVSIALIYKVSPGDIQSLSIVGALMLPVLTIPLSFDARILKTLKQGQRAYFLLFLLLLCFLCFVFSIYVTSKSIIKAGDPDGSRFDSKIIPEKTSIEINSNGRVSAEIGWLIYPLSKIANQGATIFEGLVTVHDEDKIVDGQGSGKETIKSCADTPSCLGSYHFKNLSENSIFIKSGTDGTEFSATVYLKYMPKKVRIWWEFYQIEGPSGSRCGYDMSRQAPTDGIPALALYVEGSKIAGPCYRSFGRYQFSVKE